MGRTEGNDRAVQRALVVLGERLAPEDWRRRPLGRLTLATFTRPVHGDLIATLELSRRVFRVPDGVPVTLSVAPGAGSETALGLWPLLGSTPEAAVTWDPATGWRNGTDLDLDGEAGIAAFVEKAAELADGARAFAASFPDLDALVEHERTRPRTPRPTPGEHRADRGPADTAPAPPEDGDGAAGAPRGPSRTDLVHVLATGRFDEARALLREFEAADAAAGGSVITRRFARQVRRRLDAGTATVPPLEETLALLPSTPVPDWPSWSAIRLSWSATRADGAAQRAARRAVGARAAGRTGDEVAADLRAEYAARGLQSRSSSLAIAADQILEGQRPFGRLRLAARTVAVVAVGGRRLVHGLRHLGEQPPEAIRPPDRAAYPLRDHGRDGFAAVVLDPGVDELLGVECLSVTCAEDNVGSVLVKRPAGAL